MSVMATNMVDVSKNLRKETEMKKVFGQVLNDKFRKAKEKIHHAGKIDWHSVFITAVVDLIVGIIVNLIFR